MDKPLSKNIFWAPIESIIQQKPDKSISILSLPNMNFSMESIKNRGLPLAQDARAHQFPGGLWTGEPTPAATVKKTL
jgi:hypothetical protein